MIPRMQLDIAWRDLGFALGACLRSSDAVAAVEAFERGQSADGSVLACLSVRSGFDALLQALALPRGSEVVMTAITIPPMLEIVERHGLRVVPVAVDTSTLSVSADALERAITPATRLVVVTHLLGSRASVSSLAAVARKHCIALVEDAAQAFHGDGYQGDPGSAVTMFSFGPIKTATALGGGVLHVRDAALAARIRTVLRAHRPHTRGWYLRRVLRFSAMKLLSMRLPFTVFVAACRLAKLPYDELLREWVRGFRGSDPLVAVRRAPPAALLALMERRLRQEQGSRVEARRKIGQRLADDLVSQERPGRLAPRHAFWVFPIFEPDPQRRVRQLVAAGYDVTPAASSLAEIQPSQGDTATCALRPLAGWLYLPQPATMSERERERLVLLLSGRVPDVVDAMRKPSIAEGDATAD